LNRSPPEAFPANDSALPGDSDMIVALKLVIFILLVFTALGLASAVTIADPRSQGIGRRKGPAASVDPADLPIGSLPRFASERAPGYSARELRALTREPPASDPLRRSFYARNIADIGSASALPRSADGGLSVPSGQAAVRNLFWWRRAHA
jgi:hypothetical protein